MADATKIGVADATKMGVANARVAYLLPPQGGGQGGHLGNPMGPSGSFDESPDDS